MLIVHPIKVVASFFVFSNILDVDIAQNKKNQHTFINKIAISANIVLNESKLWTKVVG